MGSFGRIVGALLISLPLSALSLPAQPAVAYSGSGQGGYEHPFLITTCLELQNMLSDTTDDDSHSLFWLANDIDCAASSSWDGGKGFKPIVGFNGTFDGRGYKISTLVINRPTEDYVGLFSELHDNPKIYNVEIDYTSSITGHDYVGSLVGSVSYISITAVKSNAVVMGNEYVGGL